MLLESVPVGGITAALCPPASAYGCTWAGASLGPPASGTQREAGAIPRSVLWGVTQDPPPCRPILGAAVLSAAFPPAWAVAHRPLSLPSAGRWVASGSGQPSTPHHREGGVLREKGPLPRRPRPPQPLMGSSSGPRGTWLVGSFSGDEGLKSTGSTVLQGRSSDSGREFFPSTP